jgi:hypothetical protein
MNPELELKGQASGSNEDTSVGFTDRNQKLSCRIGPVQDGTTMMKIDRNDRKNSSWQLLHVG